MRPSKRAADEMRKVSFECGGARYAEGWCIVRCGETHVLCTASLEDKPPPCLRGQGRGWVTAEYAMLPRATSTRTRRESSTGRVSGRTQEIQRLIGRSLRAVVDRRNSASARSPSTATCFRPTGAPAPPRSLAPGSHLRDCIQWMVQRSILKESVLKDHVAADSCGVVAGEAVIDLDYAEDSTAETDANFVMTGKGGLVEVEGSAEGAPFTEAELMKMLALARGGVESLIALQKAAIAFRPGALESQRLKTAAKP